jgi:hypothetical protein
MLLAFCCELRWKLSSFDTKVWEFAEGMDFFRVLKVVLTSEYW